MTTKYAELQIHPHYTVYQSHQYIYYKSDISNKLYNRIHCYYNQLPTTLVVMAAGDSDRRK
jgi:hypothetical protein